MRLPPMQALARGIVRYCFHFFLFYWICFTFPFPLDLVGLPFQLVEPDDQPAWMKAGGEKFGEVYSWIASEKNDACKWVADRLLHVEVDDSADRQRRHDARVRRLSLRGCHRRRCRLAVDRGSCCSCSRRKPDWHVDGYLHGLIRILVRFFLCEMLLGYGFAKVFPLQFAQPSSARLAQQLGDMSPMGLLWTFMGFSTSYQIFTGAIEVLAGLLLTTRRTTLLGAFVTIASMTHIFALNMCFDVPVKLYSFNYLLMAIFLVAPDLPRLDPRAGVGRGRRSHAIHAPARQRQARSTGLGVADAPCDCDGLWPDATEALSSGTICMAVRLPLWRAVGISFRCRLTRKNRAMTIL